MLEVYGKDQNGHPQFRKVFDTIGGGQIYSFVDGDIVFNSINRKQLLYHQ
jgi:rod shape-determining protein MreC